MVRRTAISSEPRKKCARPEALITMTKPIRDMAATAMPQARQPLRAAPVDVAGAQMLAHQCRARDRESAPHHHGRVQHVDARRCRPQMPRCRSNAPDERHEQEKAELQHELLQRDRIADVQQPLVARLFEDVAGKEFDGQLLAHPQNQTSTAPHSTNDSPEANGAPAAPMRGAPQFPRMKVYSSGRLTS